MALLKADGKKIPFVVVPASLYATVVEAMGVQSGQIFKQKARSLKFDASNMACASDLRNTLNDMQEALKNRDLFVLTDSDLHKFYVAYKEAWNTFLTSDGKDDAAMQKIAVFEEIAFLIKDGVGILDEFDMLNNCRRKYILASGEAVALNSAHCEFVADLYQAIEGIVKEASPFTHEKYRTETKEKCIDAFLTNVAAKQMPHCDAQKRKDYLLGGKAGADYIKTLEIEVQNLLCIAFDEFQELLPMTLEKRHGEHFGYSDQPGKVETLQQAFLANLRDFKEDFWGCIDLSLFPEKIKIVSQSGAGQISEQQTQTQQQSTALVSKEKVAAQAQQRPVLPHWNWDYVALSQNDYYAPQTIDQIRLMPQPTVGADLNRSFSKGNTPVLH